MSKRTLWVAIESITVDENGDAPDQKDPKGEDKRNAVLATLTYPRSGAPTVNSGRQYNLPKKKAFQPEQGDFFKCGLFKEDVQEETLLEIKITDTDKVSKAEKILLNVLSGLVGAALRVATGGLTGIFGAVAGVGCDQIKTGMAQDGDDQVYVIGQTDKIRLKMDELPDHNNPQRMTLGLTVRDPVEKPYLTPSGPNNAVVTNYVRLAKGAANGTITLRVWTTEA